MPGIRGVETEDVGGKAVSEGAAAAAMAAGPAGASGGGFLGRGDGRWRQCWAGGDSVSSEGGRQVARGTVSFLRVGGTEVARGNCLHCLVVLAGAVGLGRQTGKRECPASALSAHPALFRGRVYIGLRVRWKIIQGKAQTLWFTRGSLNLGGKSAWPMPSTAGRRTRQRTFHGADWCQASRQTRHWLRVGEAAHPNRSGRANVA